MTESPSPEASYLIAMYRALALFRAQVLDDEELLGVRGPYETYIRQLHRLIPPPRFSELHESFVAACDEMLRRLRTAETVEELGATDALEALVQPGIAAFREFQFEADRLDLGITFR